MADGTTASSAESTSDNNATTPVQRSIQPTSFCPNTKYDEGPQEYFVTTVTDILKELQEDLSGIDGQNFLDALRNDFAPFQLFHSYILSRAGILRN